MIDLAIIGGGPAGLSAGLYATRGGIKNVVLFERGMPGGQITGSSEIENYPGVKDIVSGMDFMAPWQEQCFRFGLQHKMSDVVRVSKKGEIFEIHQGDGSIDEAKSVIFCAGGSPKRANLKGEDKFWGSGISTCATCDGFFYKNQEVVVLGGGDTAIEEAIYLSRICSKVHVIHRRNEFRAAPSTLAHAKSNDKINFITPALIEEIVGDDSGVTGVRFKRVGSEKIEEIAVYGVFVFVGYEVNTSALKQEDGSMICECDEWGAIKVDLSMNTSVKGFFAAGDVRTQASKQVVCAAADGATAALQAIAYLEHA